MPSLKEIKGRIASVSSTLKITSAMKMVASAKLHKAQAAIGNMLPYEQRLSRILADLLAVSEQPAGAEEHIPKFPAKKREHTARTGGEVGRVAVVAWSSNSSLCGGFNAAVIRKTLAVVKKWEQEGAKVTVFSVGRKMADAMRKAGYPSPEDYTKLADAPSYEGAAVLADTLIAAFDEGRFDRVELVYNHFHSTASQPTRHEVYLPFSVENIPEAAPEDFIVEPSRCWMPTPPSTPPARWPCRRLPTTATTCSRNSPWSTIRVVSRKLPQKFWTSWAVRCNNRVRTEKDERRVHSLQAAFAILK